MSKKLLWNNFKKREKFMTSVRKKRGKKAELKVSLLPLPFLLHSEMVVFIALKKKMKGK